MTNSPRFYDISPVISPKTAVFPGDQPFERDVLLDFKNGDNLVLSNIRATLHLGAHTDAPSHYHAQGQTIDERPLEVYFGLCQVISVKKSKGERLRKSDLTSVDIKAPRVLFKTGSFRDPNQWTDEFNSLSAELIDFLSEKKVILVGIDTPSIDPARDKTLESHQAVWKHNMAILEGIILENIPDGQYTLASLPLRLKDCDASPVRAVLIEGL